MLLLPLLLLLPQRQRPHTCICYYYCTTTTTTTVVLRLLLRGVGRRYQSKVQCMSRQSIQTHPLALFWQRWALHIYAEPSRAEPSFTSFFSIWFCRNNTIIKTGVVGILFRHYSFQLLCVYLFSIDSPVGPSQAAPFALPIMIHN